MAFSTESIIAGALVTAATKQENPNKSRGLFISASVFSTFLLFGSAAAAAIHFLSAATTGAPLLGYHVGLGVTCVVGAASAIVVIALSIVNLQQLR